VCVEEEEEEDLRGGGGRFIQGIAMNELDASPC
jgi:hypothetical protein